MNSTQLHAYFFWGTLAVFLTVAQPAAQAPSLGTASSFGVLAASTVTNTGPTVITGNVGVSPGTALTGFPPGTIAPGTGVIHVADAVAGQAESDLTTAYNVAAGEASTANLTGQDLGGLILTPGVYFFSSSAQLTGILTLDAQNNSNAVFLFQIGSTLITATGSQVALINGAQPGNVFWQVGSSATLGVGTSFQGNIMAFTSITVSTGANVIGRVLALHGAVTVDTDAITIPGSIQVVKNTVGGDGTFPFNSNFGLASLITVGGTASQTFAGLAPGGNYNVSELVPLGWTQTSASCTNGTPAAVAVASGVTTICTFINTMLVAPPTGSITVVKNTIGGNGTFVFTSNFGLTSLTTLGGAASQTFANLTPGNGYSVGEVVPAGWTQTSVACTNGTPAAVNVVGGATTTCTFTNTLIPPPLTGSITVVKHTVGGNGSFAFASNFGLASPLTTVGGSAIQTVIGLTPGNGYSVSETVPAGWTQTSVACTNGTPAAVNVVAGSTTVCTFTNTLIPPPLPGSITVVKNTVGGNGTFLFTSNFGLIALTTTGGSASQTFNNLTAGNYSLSEMVPSGWTQNSATCTNGTPAAITVVAAMTTTCTIINAVVVVPPATGSIQVVKNTVGGDGTFAFTSNFGLLTQMTTKNGSVSSPWVMNLTPGGSYSVSETTPSGWTQISAICSNGTPAAIAVLAGVTTICTFTNSLAAPPANGSITVVKNTVGGNGTFAFISNFGLTSLTTNGGMATQTFSNVAPGVAYSLSETVPSGWTQNSAICSNGTPAAIVVIAGATTTCVIVNTKASVAPLAPDLIIAKSHVGNFRQGDNGDLYTLTVTNAGPGPTTGLVTASDTLPTGLTATAISGTGWSCTLTTLTCTRSDALAAGASYPVITITVNVAVGSLAFPPAPGSLVFETGDIFLSMADGTVQWHRHDFTLVEVLNSTTNGEAKGMAFDSSNNLYVTHWYGSGSSGNDVMTFNQYGVSTASFGSGFNCNPSSILFDSSGNAYVGQSDCGTAILKFDSTGNPLAQYSAAVENRGTYNILLDNNQCTMYYTSEGPDVKRFNVCSGTQMPNFNTAPLPDTVDGGYAMKLLPGGGMLVANFSGIASLDGSGNLLRTYSAPAPASNCWLGIALDPDGTSFWASNWCTSSVTRFDLATGNVIESHVASGTGFMVKQICIPGNIFPITVINMATVAGGGELNTVNDSASDVTIINPPPPQASPESNPSGVVNAASYLPTVAAGSIASVFGINLASGQAMAGSLPLPTTLESSSFQIGGQATPLFSASPAQVNLQIPWALAGQSQAMLTATVGSLSSTPQVVNIAVFAPGLFLLNGGTSVTAGQYITIYATGLGPVSNQPATGVAAGASPLSVTLTAPTVTIGGVAAAVSFSGLAPGDVGLYQVNVQVPAGVVGATAPVILTIGGVASNTVTIAVH